MKENILMYLKDPKMFLWERVPMVLMNLTSINTQTFQYPWAAQVENVSQAVPK